MNNRFLCPRHIQIYLIRSLKPIQLSTEKCSICKWNKRSDGKVKYPRKGALKAYHDAKRAEMSDFLLLHYFKVIRNQCKWGDRPVDTLLEYINELEYRGLRYRL